MSEAGITAVVVNYNGGEDVLRCAQALIEQETPLATIILVDNASNDGSREEVRRRFPQVEVIARPENRGPAVARNAGLGAVETEFVLFVDDDVYVRRGTIGKLLRAAQRRPRAVVCPRIVLFPEGEVVQAQGAHIHFCGLLRLHHAYRPLAAVPEAPEVVGGAITACYFGRTDSFTAPGGFDELIFVFFEDTEFSLRLRALGYDFVTEPRAIVDHHPGQGTIGLSFRGQGAYPRSRAYYSLRHRLLTIFINYRWRSIMLLAPSLLVYEGLSLAFLLSHGWGSDWLRAWRWLWRQRRSMRQHRRRVQQHRTRNDGELLVGGELPFAPGLMRSRRLAGIIQVATAGFNLNWFIVWRFI